jgi:hypothetical protein
LLHNSETRVHTQFVSHLPWGSKKKTKQKDAGKRMSFVTKEHGHLPQLWLVRHNWRDKNAKSQKGFLLPKVPWHICKRALKNMIMWATCWYVDQLADEDALIMTRKPAIYTFLLEKEPGHGYRKLHIWLVPPASCLCYTSPRVQSLFQEATNRFSLRIKPPSTRT